MIAIELFGCSGGMAEGFRRAGVEFLFAFDRDPDACDSYEANLRRRPVQIDVRDLLRLAQAKAFAFPEPFALDLLVADPPCVGWSRAGKRKGLDDERDQLWTTVELVRLLKPRAYLIGNVPGLEDAPNAKALQETIGTLEREGYCVRDSAVLDAADYGVPQHRVRPFWFGHLEGECLRWPASTHGDPRLPSLPGFLALHPWVTCGDALGDLSPKEIGRAVRMRLHPRNHKGSRSDRPARTLTGNTHSDGAVINLTRRHPPSRLDHPARVVRSSTGTSGANVLAALWDRPSTTVTNDERVPPPVTIRPGGVSVLSVPNAVVLSERARKRLQGFPDSWVISGATKKTRSSQIGQALPPPLAGAVARSIVEWFGALERAGAKPMGRIAVCGECGSTFASEEIEGAKRCPHCGARRTGT